MRPRQLDVTLRPRDRQAGSNDSGASAWVRVGRFVRNTLLIGFLGVAVAGIVVRLRTDDPSPPTSSSGVPEDEVVHLHGIGVNPADGQVYVATHTGVLTQRSDGTIGRVADRYQDTMGFTVVGPDRFVGSGHPDLREDAPSSLGLIRSDDAAQTWEPVSLYGEADLHSLVAVHDRLYAADATAGQLIVSFDAGRTWERRASIQLVALAADPTDPEALVGAGAEGELTRSDDGGRTWQPLEGPRANTLAWDSEIELLGAGSDGDVFGSRDGGRTWEQVGDLGGTGPVLTIVEGVAWAATDGGQFFRSDDGGVTWSDIDD